MASIGTVIPSDSRTRKRMDLGTVYRPHAVECLFQRHCPPVLEGFSFDRCPAANIDNECINARPLPAPAIRKELVRGCQDQDVYAITAV